MRRSHAYGEGISAIIREVHHHVLGTKEFVEAFLAPFAPEPAFLDATERCLCSGGAVGIDPDHPCVNCPADPVGAVEIPGPDSRCESEAGIVSDLDGLLL